MNEVRKSDELTFDLSDIISGIKGNLDLDDYFYLKEYSERKHYITDVIDSTSVEDACKAILQYNKEDAAAGLDKDARKPVMIYLDTPGGEVTAGMKLIDIIQSSKTPVYIVNLGTCYSMGFLIYIVGHKRFASRNATFLMHDGSIEIGGSSSKTRDYIAFNDMLEERTKALVTSTTTISSELYDEKFRKEWYMFAQEAKELGIVDYIVGYDCEIEDIL